MNLLWDEEGGKIENFDFLPMAPRKLILISNSRYFYVLFKYVIRFSLRQLDLEIY